MAIPTIGAAPPVASAAARRLRGGVQCIDLSIGEYAAAREETHALGRFEREARPASRHDIDYELGMAPVLELRRPHVERTPLDHTEEDVARVIGAESVHYLSMPGLVQSIGLAQDTLCLGCLTGRYPLDVPEERRRFQKSLEEY